ncbi:hypothetical protein [Curtobacterium sp. MCLR17_034]|uniref:hypothetical protein n=1 Tax=Curtobacterium sp. MCLR17_034 TaxID=2175623 RepID=UPI0011B50FDD|nr:hypothetical protein [Curtobacterium sp. MCLR17_034]
MRVRRVLQGLSRLNVFSVLADQFKYLTNISSNRPERLVRALVILIAPGAFVLSLLLDLHMQSVGDLVGALGLLAGVFISAFALVFSLRINLAARPTRVVERRTARLMDESALTLLAAGLLSGVDAIWLAGVSVSIPEEGYVVSAFATAVTVALSSLVVVYFLLSIRRLHKLYTDTFVPFWRVKTVVDGPTGEDSSRATKADASDIDARRNG